MHYTPEEVAKLLANRPNQPHYIASLIAECLAGERARIAASLRRSGATLPAPEVKGTPESGIITGLCIALTLVEDGPNAKAIRPLPATEE